MTNNDMIREELIRRRRGRPFVPFAIVLDGGKRAVVKHGENIAFDPTPNGRQRLLILTEPEVHSTTLSAVSHLADL